MLVRKCDSCNKELNNGAPLHIIFSGFVVGGKDYKVERDCCSVECMNMAYEQTVHNIEAQKKMDAFTNVW